MRPRFRSLGFGLIGLLLIILVATRPRQPPQPEAAPLPAEAPGAAATEASTSPVVPQSAPPAPAHALERMEDERRKWDKAAASMKLVRERLQFKVQDAWSELLATNSAAYQLQRQKAAQSPGGEIRCTLCDGQGSLLYCVLCPPSPGKCPTCKGSGKIPPSDHCPACQGSGKCFACVGSGKMACPFCNQGRFSLSLPMPPARLPID